MKNVFETLTERGFIKQTVFEEDLKKKLASESMRFYVGFDPTADSLHIGHFIPLMAMCHMQRAGHRPVVLVGGGTGMIGDPSGRTDMRSMMTKETVQHNCDCFKKQMSKFLSFSGDTAAMMVNNADWLWNLNYIEFLRDIGVYFSVNKMLTAECFKSRMEKGLSFLEFNYMLMQAYDFLYLHENLDCSLELGGDDQWNNMLAGVDLIRRKKAKDAYCMTFALLTNSEGKKMGKTAKGALWLDRNRTTPFEFYQYFRNVDDADVEKCLKLLTFLDLAEIEELVRHKDERINAAKERLAYEVTALIHSEQDAVAAQEQARAAFSGNVEAMESVVIAKDLVNIVDILVAAKLAPSKGEARRLIAGGGIRVNEERVDDIAYAVTDDTFVLHKGKKAHIKLTRS